MPAMSAPTEAAIRESLRGVIDPELRRDVVDLDMVGTIEIDGGAVRVEIILTTPGCPLRADLERQVRDHVGAVEGVERACGLRAHERGAAPGPPHPAAGRPARSARSRSTRARG